MTTYFLFKCYERAKTSKLKSDYSFSNSSMIWKWPNDLQYLMTNQYTSHINHLEWLKTKMTKNNFEWPKTPNDNTLVFQMLPNDQNNY